MTNPSLLVIGGGLGIGTQPAPTALQVVDPAALASQDSGGAKIRSKPNLTADGSAASASQLSGKPASGISATEAADPFLMDAPFFSSFRIVPPGTNPAPAPPAASTSPAVQTMAAAAASFRLPKREPNQATISVSPPTSVAAAAGSTKAGAQTASIAMGGAAARTKATYGVEAAYLSGGSFKGSASGLPAKQLLAGAVNNGDTGTGKKSTLPPHAALHCLPSSSLCVLTGMYLLSSLWHVKTLKR